MRDDRHRRLLSGTAAQRQADVSGVSLEEDAGDASDVRRRRRHRAGTTAQRRVHHNTEDVIPVHPGDPAAAAARGPLSGATCLDDADDTKHARQSLHRVGTTARRSDPDVSRTSPSPELCHRADSTSWSVLRMLFTYSWQF